MCGCERPVEGQNGTFRIAQLLLAGQNPERLLPGKLDCVLTGEKRGKTVFEPHPGGTHKVCVGVDANAMLESYLNTIVGRQIKSL